MRLKKVISLFHLFYLFFVRKVANVGLMKKNIFRLLITLITFIIIIAVSSGMYLFLNAIGNKNLEAELILDVYTGNIVIWTSIIFIFLKILFLKSSDFLKLTYQFPVKNKERNTALLLFELALSMLCVLIISSGVVIAFVAKYHFLYITKILENIFFTSITVYLFLQLIFSLLTWCISILHLKKFKILLQFFGLLSIIVVIFVFYPIIIDQMLINYLDKIKKDNLLLGYSFITSHTNIFITFFVFVIISLAMILIILIIPNNDYISDKKYLNLKFKARRINILNLYFLCLYRNIDNYSYIIISIMIYFYLFLFTKTQANLALLLPSLVGIYFFIQTDSIRWHYLKNKYNIFLDYIFLLLSQFLFIVVVSLPFVIFEIMIKTDILRIFSFYGMLITSIILFTLIGILFPPKRENPFSVFLGLVISSIIIVTLTVVLLIFNWGPFYDSLTIILLSTLMIYYSINGLKKLREDVMHGKN